MTYNKKLLDLKVNEEVRINGILMKVTNIEDEHKVDRSKYPVDVKETALRFRLSDTEENQYELRVPFEPTDLVLKKISIKQYMSAPMEDVDVLEKIPVEKIEF